MIKPVIEQGAAEGPWTKRRFSRLTIAVGSYLLMLVVPLVAGSIVYRTAFARLSDSVLGQATSAVEQLAATTDSLMRQAENMTVRISQTPAVATLLATPGPMDARDIPVVRRAMDSLSAYHLVSGSIYSLYVYFRRLNLVVEPASGYSDLQFFYDGLLRLGDLTYAQWYRLLNRYHPGATLTPTEIRLHGTPASVIPYIRSIPLPRKEPPSGTVILFFDRASLTKLAADLVAFNEAVVLVTNQLGDVMFSAGDVGGSAYVDAVVDGDGRGTSIIGGRRYSVVTVKGEAGGWVHTAFIPQSAIAGELVLVRRTALGVFAAILILGTCFAVFLARRQTRPFQRIVELINTRTVGSASSETDVLPVERAVRQIVVENERMRNAAVRHQESIRLGVYSRLLTGAFSDVDEIRAQLDAAGVEVGVPPYRVAVVDFADTARAEPVSHVPANRELHAQQLVVQELVLDCFGPRSIVHQSTRFRMACVLSDEEIDEAQPGTIEERFEEMTRRLATEYRIPARGAISSPFRSLGEAYRRFDKTNRYLDATPITAGQTLSAAGIQFSDAVGQGLPQIERLTALLVAGDAAGAHEELETIWSHACSLAVQSPVKMHRAMFRVLDALEEAVRATGGSSRFPDDVLSTIAELERINEPLRFREAADRLVSLLADHIADVRSNRNHQLAADAVALIEKHYSDSGLGIPMIAEKLELSEAYLSHQFRVLTGERMSAVIETVRMDEATRLLAEGRLAVQEIAARVGYANAGTFRKAFKRRFGTSPASLRTIRPEHGSASSDRNR